MNLLPNNIFCFIGWEPIVYCVPCFSQTIDMFTFRSHFTGQGHTSVLLLAPASHINFALSPASLMDFSPSPPASLCLFFCQHPASRVYCPPPDFICEWWSLSIFSVFLLREVFDSPFFQFDFFSYGDYLTSVIGLQFSIWRRGVDASDIVSHVYSSLLDYGIIYKQNTF